MTFKTIHFAGALAIIAGMFLTGCASTAHIEKDQAINFSKYKTYSWLEKDKSKPVKANPRNDLAEQNIHNAVNVQLQKNGWSEVSSNPDVLLSSDLLIEKTTRQERDPVYSQSYTRTYYNPYTRRYSNIYFPSQFLGYDSYNMPVKEGTVSITMIDARTDKTVWQGWNTKEMNSRYITSREIDNNVKSIFKKFEAGK